MTEPTDDALMLAYAAGDQEAFAALYQRHRGPLYRYFRRQLPPAEADDCFQSLWLKLIDQAPRYRPAGAFSAYAFTLAHSVLMDHYRRHGRLREVALGAENQADTDGTGPAGADGFTAPMDPEDAAGLAELRRRLLALLDALPFHQREAWVLKQESALSVAEIAALTGTSIEGVRSRLRYATGKLKAGLSRHV